MKKRTGSVILCVFMVIGMVFAGVTNREEFPNLQPKDDTIAVSDAAPVKEVILQIGGTLETAVTISTEAVSEPVNALGMPLLEDTALLASVTYTRLSDRYHYITDQYEYDREGRILRHLEQGLHGVKNNLCEYAYDADGRVLRENSYCAYFQKKNWELDSWTEYIYRGGENAGESRTERQYEAGGRLLQESVYDSKDRLVRRKEYSEYNDYALWRDYEYDTESRQSQWTFYDEQGEVESQTKEMYDEAGNKIRYAQYDVEGNISFVQDCGCRTELSEHYAYCRYENQYDERRNLIRQVSYDYENNEAARLINVYDGQGNLISEKYEDNQDKYENYFSEYTYDEKGNLLCRHSFDEWSEQETRSLFTYDDRNNCTQMRMVYYEEDDNGNLAPRYDGVQWERTYDDKNRIVKYIDYVDTDGTVKQYDYTYETIGIAEEDYPFGRIHIRESY